MDMDEDEGPPQLVEATADDAEVTSSTAVDVSMDDLNIAKVPITIVTGM